MGRTLSLCSKISALPAVAGQSFLAGRKGLVYSIPRVRKGARDDNGIYFFVRELGGSQEFQASLSGSLISLQRIMTRDALCRWARLLEPDSGH